MSLDPLTRFQNARNSQRRTAVESIADAVRIYQINNNGSLPSGVDGTLKMLGTAGSGCDESCGSTTLDREISYYNASESLRYFSNNVYSVRNWFDVSSINDFKSITVSAVLDCNGNCSGHVRVRIGNASSYNDYDLVDSSLVRTDGTTSNYSWYTNTYSIDKSTLGNYFFVQLLLYSGSGTINFMMDEAGPAGPDPEYRRGSNGDSSQAGWINDNGDYFIRITVPVVATTASTCLDLSTDLASNLPEIPEDPSNGSAAKTYYAIQQTGSQGGITVVSCGAESGEDIRVQK